MTEEDYRKVGYAVCSVIAKSQITLLEYLVLSHIYFNGATTKTINGVYQGSMFLNLENKKLVAQFGRKMKLSKNGHALMLDIHNQAMYVAADIEKTEVV